TASWRRSSLRRGCFGRRSAPSASDCCSRSPSTCCCAPTPLRRSTKVPEPRLTCSLGLASSPRAQHEPSVHCPPATLGRLGRARPRALAVLPRTTPLVAAAAQHRGGAPHFGRDAGRWLGRLAK